MKTRSLPASVPAMALRTAVSPPAVLLAATALLTVLATAAVAQGPVVDVSVDPPVATVGDRMTLTVRVEVPDGTSVEYPDVASEVAPLAVLSSVTTGQHEEGEGVVEELYYVLAAFETGALGIPQLPFAYKSDSGDSGIVWTDSLTVEIESVIPDTLKEQDKAPRDIKPPVDLPVHVWPYILAAALVCSALAGLYYLRKWWLSRKRKPALEKPMEPVVPRRAAHLVALERLVALEVDDPAGRGDIVGFYVRATEIVRLYIRDRFAVDAIDMTTSELARAMERARMDREETDWAVRFLSRADLAKFAKHTPGVEKTVEDLHEAREFVERTRFMGEDSGESAENATPEVGEDGVAVGEDGGETEEER